MNLPVRHLKISLSLVLAVSVLSLFTLRSFAATDNSNNSNSSNNDPGRGPKPPAGAALGLDDCIGILTIKSGKAFVNGNEVKTGATVTSGSLVSTSDDGRVIIDLDTRGRIQLDRHTTITWDCSLGVIQGHTTCNGKVHIESHVGHVDVTVPKVESIQAGKDQTYDDPVDFTAPYGSSIEIECGRHVAGAGVAGGVVLGGGITPPESRPPVSGA